MCSCAVGNLQVSALKGLSLNVRRAKVKHADDKIKNKFYVTDAHTADKINKSARLEEIRLSILQVCSATYVRQVLQV